MTHSPAPPAEGSVIRIEVDGSSIIGYDDATPILSATNTDEPGGVGNRRSMIACYAEGNANILVYDNFSYGDIAVAPAQKKITGRGLTRSVLLHPRRLVG